MSETPSHHLNATLDQRINDRGFFERILTEQAKTDGEREKRLNERFEAQEKAVAAALAAQEKATTVALLAAEKAVDKAEQAQLRVNVTQNEFRGTLKDQNAATERTMMPRAETELLVRELRAQLESVRGVQAKMVGGLVLITFGIPFLSGLLVFALSR